MAPVVGEPAARIGIDRAEQSLQRIEQADDQHASAKSFEILGREAEPETFAGSGQHERHEQQHDVASQGEEVGAAAPVVHVTRLLDFDALGEVERGW